MTYFLNIENTGLDCDDKVRKMVIILEDFGYDVEFTSNLGLVNPVESCPCNDSEWENALILSDA